MSTIYTIGFSGKNIDALREVLDAVGVRTLIDIRRWPVSKYAPWADGENLRTALGAQYKYMPELAPTPDLLANYKAGNIDWSVFENKFKGYLASICAEKMFNANELHKVCFLCTEKTAEKCHRRLVAEYLVAHYPDINIAHL